MVCLAVSRYQHVSLLTICEQRTLRVVALDGGPGEGVRLEAVADAVYTTHAFDGSVDIGSSGVAWSVGASGIGVSATVSLG